MTGRPFFYILNYKNVFDLISLVCLREKNDNDQIFLVTLFYNLRNKPILHISKIKTHKIVIYQ